MQREYKTAALDSPLEAAIEMFPHADSTPILVFQDEVLVGMLTLENLGEFVMLEHAKSQSGGNK